MSEVIKKISAFENLPVNGVTSNTEFIVAKEGYNYKMSFNSLYSAIDKYMNNNNSSNVINYVNNTFVKTETINQQLDLLATKESLDELNDRIDNFVSQDDIDTINENIQSLSDTKLDSTVFNEFNTQYNELVSSLDTTYVKLDELESYYSIDEIDNMFDYMQTSIDSNIDDVNSKVEVIQTDIDNINDTLSDILSSLETSPSNVVITNGSSYDLLGADGKYHNLNALEILHNEELPIDNSHIEVTMPEVPNYFISEFDICIDSPLIDRTNIISVSIVTQFANITYNLQEGKSSINVKFETTLKTSSVDNETVDIVKVKTYIDNELVSDKLEILDNPALTGVHSTYTVPIDLTLNNTTIDDTSKLKFRVIGYK